MISALFTVKHAYLYLSWSSFQQSESSIQTANGVDVCSWTLNPFPLTGAWFARDNTPWNAMRETRINKTSSILIECIVQETWYVNYKFRYSTFIWININGLNPCPWTRHGNDKNKRHVNEATHIIQCVAINEWICLNT